MAELLGLYRTPFNLSDAQRGVGDMKELLVIAIGFVFGSVLFLAGLNVLGGS